MPCFSHIRRVVGFEPLQQRRHPVGKAAIDAKLIDHSETPLVGVGRRRDIATSPSSGRGAPSHGALPVDNSEDLGLGPSRFTSELQRRLARGGAVRRVLFTSVGVADNSGPSVRPRPLYSSRQRSYSRLAHPDRAQRLGDWKAFRRQRLDHLKPLDDFPRAESRLHHRHPPRTAFMPQASDRRLRSRAGQCASSAIRKLAGALSL